MRFELIISSLQDWCLTIMALEAYVYLLYKIFKYIVLKIKKYIHAFVVNRTRETCLVDRQFTTSLQTLIRVEWKLSNVIMLYGVFHYNKGISKEMDNLPKIIKNFIIKIYNKHQHKIHYKHTHTHTHTHTRKF